MARKTPLKKPDCGEGIVSRKLRQKSAHEFCARRDSIERNSYGNVAGWLGGWVAGCPSHSGIVSKRLNLSENLFDHLKAPSL